MRHSIPFTAALSLVGLACCSTGSGGSSTSCATTADCPPGTVCVSPRAQCEPTPDDELLGTFRCYVVASGQTTAQLGNSEVEGSYRGATVNLLEGTACTFDTTDTPNALLVQIYAIRGAAGDYAGLSLVLPWGQTQTAPVDVRLGAPAGSMGSGALMASADGGAAYPVATVTTSGVVHLDQPPAAGQWLSGYVDAPVQ